MFNEGSGVKSQFDSAIRQLGVIGCLGRLVYSSPVRVERSRDAPSSVARSLGFARLCPSTSLGTNGDSICLGFARVALVMPITAIYSHSRATPTPTFPGLGVFRKIVLRKFARRCTPAPPLGGLGVLREITPRVISFAKLVGGDGFEPPTRSV